MRLKTRSAIQLVAIIIAGLGVSGCAVFSPLPQATMLDERLQVFPTENLPLEAPVEVYWSDNKIPFIHAQTDEDAAFALGMIHAHLRLGQMEIMRHVSQGRLAEIAGPFATIKQMEHALRVIDLGKSSHEVYAAMPAESRIWLDRFVDGINYYQENMDATPHELKVLGVKPSPWEAHELLTIGRLASVDPNWTTWLELMPLRERKDWPEIWARAVEEGTTSATSFAWKGNAPVHQFARLLTIAARWGSNSFAISKQKTATGSSIIASDPHLGFGLPNIWLIAGIKSPSFHMVGLMVPGMPFVAVGRNERIAWGGTSLYSNNSDLFDVRDIPQDQIVTRKIVSKVRWWFDREIEIRDTPYGPIISDVGMVPKLDGEQFALKWIGHLPTDELTAMMRMNQAANWDEFRTALEGFSISAQNFVYADVDGNIGQLAATHMPKHTGKIPDDLILPIEDAKAWETILTSKDLPSIYNPASGFVATANNKPAETDVPIGYFYSGDDRVNRMRDVLGNAQNMSVQDVRKLQTDTYMESAVVLRDAIVVRGREIRQLPEKAVATLKLIEDWDGRYEAEAKGPVALQGVVARLIPAMLSDANRVILETGGNALADYGRLIMEAKRDEIDGLLAYALEAAQATLLEYPTWGDMHPLRLRHNLAMVPFLEKRYSFDVMPWPGSTDTIWKGDHAMGISETLTRYGAQARHVSDMSDMDANWFVLLGGNDGWMNAENFLDQAEMFREGKMIQVPMRLETVRRTFPYRTTLRP